MNSKISKVIGKKINALLAKKFKRQKDLATALGVNDNTISYFVSGKRLPNTEQIIKISDFFGVSADYLLGRTDDQTDHTTHPGTATPAPAHPIAAMFDQLDKVDQARVEAYIVSILESEKYNDQKKKRHA